MKSFCQVGSPALLFLALAALCSCAAPNQDANPSPGFSSAGLLRVPRSQAASALYVLSRLGIQANTCGAVSIYDLPVTSPRQIITQKLGSASAMALDKAGNVYVANNKTPKCSLPWNIVAFHPGASSPFRVLTSDIGSPTSIILDPMNNLYVAQNLDDNFLTFAPGSKTPVQTFLPGGSGASIVALDSQGNLYVAGGWTVYVYARGSSKPERGIDECGGQPRCTNITAIALDTAGNLYVANAVLNSGNPGFVAVYPPNATQPSRKITAGVNGALALAVDSAENLYVANGEGPGTITEYAKNASKPSRTINAGAPMSALLVDSEGTLYACSFANSFGVALYPSGATKPSLRITKGFNQIADCAFGPPAK